MSEPPQRAARPAPSPREARTGRGSGRGVPHHGEPGHPCGAPPLPDPLLRSERRKGSRRLRCGRHELPQRLINGDRWDAFGLFGAVAAGGRFCGLKAALLSLRLNPTDKVMARLAGGLGRPLNLETAVEVNHERHENKEPNRGWPAPNYLTRPMLTPNSASHSPFVCFVCFVVPTAFFRLNGRAKTTGSPTAPGVRTS